MPRNDCSTALRRAIPEVRRLQYRVKGERNVWRFPFDVAHLFSSKRSTVARSRCQVKWRWSAFRVPRARPAGQLIGPPCQCENHSIVRLNIRGNIGKLLQQSVRVQSGHPSPKNSRQIYLPLPNTRQREGHSSGAAQVLALCADDRASPQARNEWGLRPGIYSNGCRAVCFLQITSHCSADRPLLPPYG